MSRESNLNTVNNINLNDIVRVVGAGESRNITVDNLRTNLIADLTSSVSELADIADLSGETQANFLIYNNATGEFTATPSPFTSNDIENWHDVETFTPDDFTYNRVTATVPFVADTYDLETIHYQDKSFDVSAQDTNPSNMHFNDDGTKMYVLGLATNTAYQYSLSTAYEITTASYDNVSFAVGNGETNPTGFTFKPDGSKMYVVGATNDTIYQYSLSTPWDLSTASYDNKSLNAGFLDTIPRDITFNDDGTKLYMVGSQSDGVYEYNLVFAPYDISGGSYAGVNIDVTAQDNTPQGIVFHPSGLKMYIIGSDQDNVNQYSLTTAWDLSTATFDTITGYVGDQSTSPTGIAFNNDGTQLYMIADGTVDTVYQYSVDGIVPDGFDLESCYYDTNSLNAGTDSINPLSIEFNDIGERTILLDSNSDSVHQYTVQAPFDLYYTTYDNVSFDVSPQDTVPKGIEFSDDGTKMYMVGDNTDTVYQYTTLTTQITGWRIDLTTYDNISLNINAQDQFPRDVEYNDDGTKMYVLGREFNNVYQYSLSTAYDLSTASYDNVSFDISGQDNDPHGITFKPDGTKMYMAGQSGAAIYQYTLSTPYDLSTASYDNLSYGIFGIDNFPRDIALKPDGSKMYVLGRDNNRVYQFTLSTPFVVSSASYDNVSILIQPQENSVQGFTFKPDGTKMYVVGFGADRVFEYSLSTAWDLSTASYAGINFSTLSQDGGPMGLSFKPDGEKLIVVGDNTDTVYQYSPTLVEITGWEISAASYDTISHSVAAQDTSPRDITFKPDGTKMYMVGDNTDTVYQYTLSTAYDLSTTTYDTVSFDVSADVTNPTGIAFNNNGTKMYISDESTSYVHQYTLTTAYDISTSFYDTIKFDVTEDASIQDITFNPDGTRLYVAGASTDTVYQYVTESGVSLSDTHYDNIDLNVAPEDSMMRGITFNPDGTKMYTIGATNNTVYQYSLSTPNDLSTATYDNVSYDVSAQDADVYDLAFNNLGTKMYVLGDGNNAVYQYTLASAYDLSNVTYNSSYTVAQTTTPRGITFNDSGSRLYVIDSVSIILQYNLATPFDLSTTTYSAKSFNVNSQDTITSGLCFNNVGTKMYVAGVNTNTLYEYDLSTPYDISTTRYFNVRFDISAQTTNPVAIAISTDEEEFYIIDGDSNDIHQYSTSIFESLLVIPTEALISEPVGTYTDVYSADTNVNVRGDTGVVINSPSSPVIAPGLFARFIKTGDNEWDMQSTDLNFRA